MDYATRPMKRIEARKIASVLRTLLGYDGEKPFDPLRELDRINSFIREIDYEVVEDDELPRNVHASCEIGPNDTCLIKIKESIYEGARSGIGGYRMDITHEIAHALLYRLGYRPIMSRGFENNTLNPCISAEWQAKAVAGEVMIPYEATKDMSINEIVWIYGVSFDAAEMRKKLP